MLYTWLSAFELRGVGVICVRHQVGILSDNIIVSPPREQAWQARVSVHAKPQWTPPKVT